MSHICFIDESGDRDGLLSPGRMLEGQPVYVVLGLIVPESALARVAAEFPNIRDAFAPGQSEAKGNALRGDLKKPPSAGSRHAGLIALRDALKLLEGAGVNARVTGRAVVKRPGAPFNGAAADAQALRFVAENFSRFLRGKGAEGRIVLDSRGGTNNSDENKRALKAMRRLSARVRAPLQWPPIFARSEECVGLQLADWICSALVAPVAAAAYCGELAASRHVHPNYLRLRDRHGGGDWLWRRQLRFKTGGRMRWGLEVDDPRGRSSEFLFRAPAQP